MLVFPPNDPPSLWSRYETARRPAAFDSLAWPTSLQQGLGANVDLYTALQSPHVFRSAYNGSYLDLHRLLQYMHSVPLVLGFRRPSYSSTIRFATVSAYPQLYGWCAFAELNSSKCINRQACQDDLWRPMVSLVVKQVSPHRIDLHPVVDAIGSIKGNQRYGLKTRTVPASKKSSYRLSRVPTAWVFSNQLCCSPFYPTMILVFTCPFRW